MGESVKWKTALLGWKIGILKMENGKATVKWKIGFLRLENEKYLFLRPENGNSTPYCPPHPSFKLRVIPFV